MELLAVEKWLACISISGVCLKHFFTVTPNVPHLSWMGNERFNAIAFQTANALATVLLATTVMSVYYRAQLRKSMGHYVIKRAIPFNSLITNQ